MGQEMGKSFVVLSIIDSKRKIVIVFIKSNDSTFFILLLRRSLKVKFILDNHAIKVFRI